VLADAEDIQPGLVGEPGQLQHLAHALTRGDGLAGGGIGDEIAEGVEAELDRHGSPDFGALARLATRAPQPPGPAAVYCPPRWATRRRPNGRHFKSAVAKDFEPERSAKSYEPRF